MSMRSPVSANTINEMQEVENRERCTVKELTRLANGNEHESEARCLVATRHVEMLLPPVIGTTTFSSETKSHVRAASLTRNSATQGVQRFVKSELPIDKPMRILEPISCNKKFDINNRLSSSSSCNALSSTTTTTTSTSTSQDNNTVTVELGESETVNVTNTFTESLKITVDDNDNVNSSIANKINVITNYPKRTSQICNNAMSTAVESIDDDDNDARGNTIVANTNTSNAYPLTKHSNTEPSRLHEMKKNDKGKVRLSCKHKTKKSSPHYVFERLTLANTKASLELTEEIQTKEKKEESLQREEEEEWERENWLESSTVNKMNNRDKSISNSKVVNSKNVCIDNEKENKEQDAEEAERQRIALLQQFHHDVDVIENKGKELIRSQSCSSALLASSLSKWRERMNTSPQEICMANSFVLHDCESKNCSNILRAKSHAQQSSLFRNRRDNNDKSYSSGNSEKSCVKTNRSYNKSTPMSYVVSSEKQKQFVVPLQADSDTEEEEQEVEQKAQNKSSINNGCTDNVNCANVNEYTRALNHKAAEKCEEQEQEIYQMHTDSCNNQISNTKIIDCKKSQRKLELSHAYNKCNAAQEKPIHDTEYDDDDDDIDDVTFSFTQYRKSSVRLSRSPSQTNAHTTALSESLLTLERTMP